VPIAGRQERPGVVASAQKLDGAERTVCTTPTRHRWYDARQGVAHLVERFDRKLLLRSKQIS